MYRIWESFSNQKELNLSKIEIVAENLNKIGTGIIDLVGGEPFQQDDLASVVSILVNKGLTVCNRLLVGYSALSIGLLLRN